MRVFLVFHLQKNYKTNVVKLEYEFSKRDQTFNYQKIILKFLSIAKLNFRNEDNNMVNIADVIEII